MKIGFFTDTYQQINGVTTIIHSLERQLTMKGHDVFIFAPRGPSGTNIKKPNLFTSESIRFPISPEYKWALFPIFTVKETSELGLDIIHLHSPVSMGLSGLINGKRLGIPIVGTVHTIIPEFWKDFIVKLLPYVAPPIIDRIFKPIIDTAVDFSSLFMEHFSWRYYARFFNLCDIVTVPSTFSKNLCESRGIKDPLVVPNGIEFSKFHQLEKAYDFHEKWGLGKNDKIFLTVGRLSEEKNLDLLLKAVKEIQASKNGVKFLIVGDGQQATKLKHLSERLEIQDSVIFTGYVNYDELGLFYKNADWLVVTSPHETFGLTVVEAMHFGCPVLGVNSGGITDIIEDNKNGLFFDGTIDDLAKKLLNILEKPKKFEKFRKNAQKTSEKYEMDKCTDNLIEIYEKLLDKK